MGEMLTLLGCQGLILSLGLGLALGLGRLLRRWLTARQRFGLLWAALAWAGLPLGKALPALVRRAVCFAAAGRALGRLPVPLWSALPPWAVPLLLAVWAGGAAAVGLGQLRQHLALRRLCRAALPAGAQAHAALRRAAAQLGVSALPRLLVSPAVTSPVLAGLGRPVLLLPAALPPPQLLHPMLLHELTHWRRKDLWALAALQLARLVYWFSPVVWCAGRAFRTLLEQACDEQAVQKLGRAARRQYGLALLAAVPCRAAGGLGFSPAHDELKERLEQMLLTKPSRPLRGAATLLLFLALAAGGSLGVYALAQPPKPAPLPGMVGQSFAQVQQWAAENGYRLLLQN